ncbi:MAG: SLBB domain-containing protein [Chitinophagaceae bacterium]
MWLKKIVPFLFLLSFLIVLPFSPTRAQTVTGTNLSGVNVDNLTDAQIRAYMTEAEQRGMDPNQVQQLAIAKGMSADQIQQLKSRVARIEAEDKAQTPSLQGVVANRSQIPLTVGPGVNTSTGPKIFGQDLFRNPNMSFEPNLNIPTPKNYVVGPQDEIVLDIYGYSEATYHLTVSNEGSINIPYIGIVYVNGLTLDQVSTKIKAKLSTIYSGIKTGKTSVQVSIGRIRSIKVTILGEVVKPGTYTLPSLATLFNALYASGGPATNGSFRNIEVIRNNVVVDKLDVYDFLMHGDQTKNIALQDQDVIRVPTYKEHVEIQGQVKRPGIYEMLPGEHLNNLITYAGGFTDSAYTAMIKVVQLTPKEKKITDIASSDFASFPPLNGDLYLVSSILDKYSNRVTIKGAVYRPGAFELTDGLTLSQLIKKADGLKEDAFLPRGIIIRKNPDLTTSMVPFNVADIMDGQQADIPLRKEDVVQIYSIFDLRDQYTVSISGEVRNPGDFNYADSMTLGDLILQAGGFKAGATPERIEVSRRMVNSNPNSTSSKIAQIFQVNVDQDLNLEAKKFVLQPFDIVVVRSEPGYQVQKQVRIEGEVLYPGLYTIDARNERIGDLVKRAGGLTALAYPEGASLKREPEIQANGLEQKSLLQSQQYEAILAQDSSRTYDALLQQKIKQNDYVGIELDKILKNPDSKYDLFLENGDILNVPKQLQTIQIKGAVLYPVTTPFVKGRRVKYYISEAGGYDANAKTNRIYVIYPNGFVRSTHNFVFFKHFPRVAPGSVIFIPQKPAGHKFTAAEVLGLTTGAASMTAIVLEIINLIRHP